MVMVVVVVKKYQFGYHLAVMGTSQILIRIFEQSWRCDRGWRWGGGRRWTPKAGHLRLGSVEVFIGCAADIQNSGLGPYCGLLRRHECPTHLPYILRWHVKSLCALLLFHLPPVLIGLPHQHVPFSLADRHHLVFGLVLIVVLHLDVDLARGDGQPLSVSHDCRNTYLNSDLSCSATQA